MRHPSKEENMKRILALLAAIVLLASACGSDDPDASSNDRVDEVETGATSDGDDGEDEVDAVEGDSGEEWPDSLVFAMSDAEGQEEALLNYSALLSAMKEDLGGDIEIEHIVTTQAAGLVEAALAEEVDILQLGPLPAGLLVDRDAPYEVIGVTSGAPEEPINESVGFAFTESGIEDFTDLVGEDVCFGDPGSTTGSLYPNAALVAAGVDPESDLNAIYTGGHDQSVQSVVAGDCIAGFSYGRFVEERMVDEGLYELEDITIFYREELPSGGFMINTTLPNSLFEAIETSLIENNGDVLYERGLCPDELVEEDGPTGAPWCALGPNTWGVWPVEPGYFEPVIRMCEATNAPACEEDAE